MVDTMINLQNIKSLQDLNLKLDPVMDVNAGLTAEDLAMTQQILDTLDEIEQMMEQYEEDYEDYKPITYKDIADMMGEWRIAPLLNKYNIKVCYGDKFCADTENRIVIIPKEIDADMEETLGNLIIYINKHYGTDLNPYSINDICLFPVLHEIGHIVDKKWDSPRYNKKYGNKKKKIINKRDKKLNVLYKLDKILYNSYWIKYDEEKPDTVYDKIMISIIKWNCKQIKKAIAKCSDKYRRIPQERFADKYAVNQIFTGQYNYCGV